MLAETLRRLIENPELGRHMGEEGRRRVEEKFSWASIAERTEQPDAGAIEEFKRAEDTA